MIVSIHVPKTAGTSFGQSLQGEFGDRLMFDYGGWAGYSSPEATARRKELWAQMRARRDELMERFDAIHGHFVADKYANLFPQTDFVAFFRDPYQQALSNYYFLLGNPQLDHPVARKFHDAKMTIFDYLSWEETANPQTALLGSAGLDSLAMVGLTEEYGRGVALFNSTFGRRLADDVTLKVNPEREGEEYEIGRELGAAVRRSRRADLDLYRRAKEVFAAQALHRSV